MSVKASLRAMTPFEREKARLALDLARPEGGPEVIVWGIFTGFGAFFGAAVGAAVLGIAEPALRLKFGDWIYRAIATFALIGAIVVAWLTGRSFLSHWTATKPLEEDVEHGVVEVLEVEAFVAWREGGSLPAFTLDVAEEKPLTVRGAGLADAVAAGRFPCRRFSLVRLPATKHVLSVEARGEPLPVRG